MADEPSPKKVVKRVVKKAPAEPTIRYGRPAAKPKAPKVATRPSSTTARPRTAPTEGPEIEGSDTELLIDEPTVEAPAEAAPTSPAPGKPTPPSRRAPSLPKVDVSAGLGAARDRMSGAGSGLVRAWRRVIAWVAGAFWWVIDGVRDWWLPALRPIPASLATGLVTGAVAVGLGFGTLQVFEWLRGVAGGGGTWGSLTFVVVAFIAFALGEWLLGGFKVPSPRLTSILGVIITTVAMLGLFLEQADSQWALLVVPLTASVAFAVAHWLMAAAEASATEDQV